MHLVSLKDGKMSHSGDNNIRIKPAVCDVFAISRLYFSLIRHLLIKKAWLGDSGPRFGLSIFMFLLHSDKVVVLLAALYQEVLAVDDLMRQINNIQHQIRAVSHTMIINVIATYFS